MKKTISFILKSLSILFLMCPLFTGCAQVSPGATTIHIFSINDFHGQLSRTSQLHGQPVGTAACLGTYIRKYKSKDPSHTLLVHAGDIVGASAPPSALLQDEPTIAILNSLCFDVGTLGNHELDEGPEEMLRLIKGGTHPKTGHFTGATFPYIVANVIDRRTQKPILPPSFVKEIDGVKIGFIGVVTKETPDTSFPGAVKNLQFLDEATSINREAKKLKEQGVHALMVLAHEGGFQNEKTGHIKGPIAAIAQKLDPDISVIFSGHTHSEINGMVNNKLIVQARSYGSAIACVDVRIDRESGRVIHKEGRIAPTYQKNITPDPIIQNIVDRATETVNPTIKRKIATTSTAITNEENKSGESPLGNLIADAHRTAMQSDFAFMNPKGIRASLPEGEVTWGDLYTVMPYGNQLVKMDLTGAQIRQVLTQQFQIIPRILKVSGLTFSYNPKLPVAKRILEIRKTDGTPLDMNKIYTVTVNNFLAYGGDGFSTFRQGKNWRFGPIDIAAVITYMMHLPQPFTYKTEGRIQLVT